MSLKYSIKEGLAGFSRAKFASIATTGSMAVALVLIGIFILMSYEARSVSDWLRQRVGELELFLDESAGDQLGNAIYNRALGTPGIESAEYVSKSEAVQIFKREFGEDGDVFYDEPFLPASVKVRVSPGYANKDSLAALTSYFSAWNRIDDVVYNESLLDKVMRNMQALQRIGGWLGLLVVIASIFLVANTIRLSIFGRRLLIRTMKLVGATDSFIRRPFLVEGVAQGLIAAILASAVLIILYSVLRGFVPQFGTTSGIDLAALLVIIMLLFGAFLGWSGSFFAVRRFIKDIYLH